MALFPVIAGTFQVTVAVCETPANAALTFCGAEGTPGVDDGNTAFVVVPGPAPTEFTAVTVNVYWLLLVSPLIVALSPPVLVAGGTAPPPAIRLVETVYVTGSPPLLAGGVQLTLADPLPGEALALAGAPGNVAGVTALEPAPALCAPLSATTVNVYDCPLVSPVITAGFVAVPKLVANVTGVSGAGLPVTRYRTSGTPPVFAGGA